ncbi:RidA family protein [Reichenbachiella carrageenanivorans]|uniref:RidA family protein n=1 Tax=Reichenbachiella carrageenanivorans TaxID=2979869 RepID=A0ABY6D3L8_9BACT|nr:RidA family protein [Reichenbachiella carrageenanivorans]UXX80747.1 RidA family protein [Reichenbachiella carrageenanivorans]
MKKIINTENAPAPIGPYSQSTLAGNTLYVSGQIAIVPGSDQIMLDSIEEETHQVMKNMGAILEAAGTSYSNVVKCSIFVSDMGNFGKINAVYGEYFSSNPPARETVEVSCLPKNVNVEISCIAVL